MDEDNDIWCAGLIAAPDAKEARSWIASGPDRGLAFVTLGDLETNEDSLVLVEEAYSLGAVVVTAVEITDYPEIDGGLESTDYLVLELPANPAERAALFEWADEIAEEFDYESEVDYGQKFLFVSLE